MSEKSCWLFYRAQCLKRPAKNLSFLKFIFQNRLDLATYSKIRLTEGDPGEALNICMLGLMAGAAR